MISVAEQSLTKFEKRLLPIARVWHGVIPTWEARRRNIDMSELRRWASRNPDVDHPERGIYLWWVDDPRVDFERMGLARKLAKTGPDAVLWGPSVIDLMELGTWWSPATFIADIRYRKSSEAIIYKKDTGFARQRLYGLPAQNAKDALKASKPYLDSDKWEEVLKDAEERDLIQAGELV